MAGLGAARRRGRCRGDERGEEGDAAAEELLRVHPDLLHEDHEHLRGSVGGPFDSTAFDVALLGPSFRG